MGLVMFFGMKKSGTTRRVTAVAFLAAALFTAAPAQVADANVFKATVDILVVRPLQVLRTCAGIGVAVPIALLALPSGQGYSKAILREFVVEPGQAIYKPRLGDWEYSRY